MLLDGIDNNINEYTDSGKAGYGGKLYSFWQRVNNSDHLSRSWYWAEGYCICLDCNWMNSIQGGSGPIKKPASAGFNVIGSRDSVAYPFLSPHRLVGVLLRLITSCFCWRSPYTVQSLFGGAGGSWTRVRNSYILGTTCLVSLYIRLPAADGHATNKLAWLSFNASTPGRASTRSLLGLTSLDPRPKSGG